MEAIKQWIESHPYLAGGGLLAVVVLFLVTRSGSASSTAQTQAVAQPYSTANDSAYQVAALQASTAMAGTQAQAQVANNQLSAALAAKQIDAATTQAANDLAAQVQLEQLHVAGDVQNNANQFAYQTVVAQTTGATDIAKINADATTAQTQANVSLFQTILSGLVGTKTSTSASGGGTTGTVYTSGATVGGGSGPGTDCGTYIAPAGTPCQNQAVQSNGTGGLQFVPYTGTPSNGGILTGAQLTSLTSRR